MQLKASSVRLDFQESCNYECHSNNTASSISNDTDKVEISRSPEACLFCKGRDGLLIRLENGALSHITCRESQKCCFCKDTGMTVLCPTSQCIRVFHPWCADILVTHECDQHSASAKKKEKLQVMYTASQLIPEYTELATQLKATFPHICAGHILWYIIGTQYFSKYDGLPAPECFPMMQSTSLDYPLNSTSDSNYVETLLSQYQQEISELQSINTLGIQEISTSMTHTHLKHIKLSRYTTLEEFILSQIKALHHKPLLEEYLKYFEQKVKCEVSSNEICNKPSCKLGTRELPKNEEDFVCAVCNDGDYEEDDLIVICSKCEMGAHMKCYGIVEIPEGDWICDVCREFDKEKRTQVPCALCPIKGFALKPTIHTKEEGFKNYEEKDSPEKVWVHSFCASQIENIIIRDRAKLEGIDLSKIDPRRYSMKCQVCGTKNGAVIQCQHGRCQVAFHPECAKGHFTNTRDKTGYEEVSIYCMIHKPLKLRRMIESKEKKYVEELKSYFKLFEHKHHKLQNKQNRKKRVRTRVDKHMPMSIEEKLQFRDVLNDFLHKINSDQKMPISLSIRLSSETSLRNYLSISMPDKFTLLDPSIVLNSKLSIPSRKPEECYKYYSNTLFNILKRELEIQNIPVNLYKTDCKKRKDKSEKIKKTRGRKPMTRNKNMDVDEIYMPSYYSEILDDVVTDELYCICRQPFKEKLARDPEWTDQEYEQKLWESNLIQCDGCEDWFHQGCMKIPPGIHYDEWKCQLCQIKKPKCDIE